MQWKYLHVMRKLHGLDLVFVSGIGEETEVGVDGWDEMDGAYAFCYSGNNELGLSKSVTVKCLAVGDSLMIDAISSDVDNPVHLELK